MRKGLRKFYRYADVYWDLIREEPRLWNHAMMWDEFLVALRDHDLDAFLRFIQEIKFDEHPTRSFHQWWRDWFPGAIEIIIARCSEK